MRLNSIRSFLNQDGVDILGCTLAQFIWTWKFLSLKAGLVNLLPTFVFLSIWYLFTKTEYRQQKWLYFIPGLLLTLRLPVTLSGWLEPVSWLMFFTVIFLVFKKVFSYFQSKKNVGLLITAIAIVLGNAVGHISLDSPYTYTFRLINGLESKYAGVENNTTWECPYETRWIAVSCDMRHFIASEEIFTEADTKRASDSVLLSRFFYGYLSSLVGVAGHRWLASFTLNLLLWIGACAALYRICWITALGRKTAAIALLCCASSWGFLHFVGQPSPHVFAYAYAAIALWATLEIIGCSSGSKIALLCAVIIVGPLAYQTYPVTLTSVLLLFLYGKRSAATLVLFAPIVLNFLWKNVSLQQFLGTVGAVQDQSSGSQNIAHDIKVWLSVVTNLDLSLGWQLLSKGIQSYIYGSMIFGAFASLIFIGYLAIHIKTKPSKEHQLLLISCASLSLLTLLTTLFVAPQTMIWSPSTGMQPRLAGFVYPANTIAIAAIARWLFKGKMQYAPAVATFLIANIDLIGLASLPMFFDYGAVGVYWK